MGWRVSCSPCREQAAKTRREQRSAPHGRENNDTIHAPALRLLFQMSSLIVTASDSLVNACSEMRKLSEGPGGVSRIVIRRGRARSAGAPAPWGAKPAVRSQQKNGELPASVHDVARAGLIRSVLRRRASRSRPRSDALPPRSSGSRGMFHQGRSMGFGRRVSSGHTSSTARKGRSFTRVPSLGGGDAVFARGPRASGGTPGGVLLNL